MASTPFFIYIINPFQVNTENIRPRLSGYDIYRLPSKSMVPTLVPGDLILVSQTAYHQEKPKRGDVVVFNREIKEKGGVIQHFVKRVIGLPSDKVKIVNGTVYVNNLPIKEDYIQPGSKKPRYSKTWRERLVPKGMIFVLGDNRDKSNDSRAFGFIPLSTVMGKAKMILYGNNGRSGESLE